MMLDRGPRKFKVLSLSCLLFAHHKACLTQHFTNGKYVLKASKRFPIERVMSCYDDGNPMIMISHHFQAS